MAEAVRRSLFAIEQEYMEIMYVLEENEGEITEELAKKLDINRDDLEAKVKAYHHIMVMNDSDVSACKAEIERLQGIIQKKEKNNETLKKALLTATLIYGETGKTGNKKLKFDTLMMWTKKTKSVNVNEDTFDDSKFINYTTTYKFKLEDIKNLKEKLGIDLNTATLKKNVEKTKIKEFIEAGNHYNKAEIVEKDSLTIK